MPSDLSLSWDEPYRVSAGTRALTREETPWFKVPSLSGLKVGRTLIRGGTCFSIGRKEKLDGRLPRNALSTRENPMSLEGEKEKGASAVGVRGEAEEGEGRRLAAGSRVQIVVCGEGLLGGSGHRRRKGDLLH